MGFTDIIIIAVIACVIVLAIIKLVRDKKKGVMCAGCIACPYSDDCKESRNNSQNISK